MRRATVPIAAFVLVAAAWGATSPHAMRAAIAAMEKSIDQRFTAIVPDNPYVLLGMTRGIYLDGYGAVFSSEVNLLPGVSMTPFTRTISPERAAASRETKIERLKELRVTMREVLINSAASLDVVPESEQIVVGVTIFNHAWEDTTGFPSQIVIQARRRTLLDLQASRGDKAKLEASIQVREF